MVGVAMRYYAGTGSGFCRRWCSNEASSRWPKRHCIMLGSVDLDAPPMPQKYREHQVRHLSVPSPGHEDHDRAHTAEGSEFQKTNIGTSKSEKTRVEDRT